MQNDFLLKLNIKKIMFILFFIQFLLMPELGRGEKSQNSKLLKIQKKLYQKHNWDRFFGNALFYRYHHQISNEPIEFKMVALEVLALGKLCRWNNAEYILKKLKENPNISKSKYKNLKIHYQALKYTDLGNLKHKKYPKGNMFSKKLKWRIKFKQIKRIKKPKQIRLKVKDQCN